MYVCVVGRGFEGGVCVCVRVCVVGRGFGVCVCGCGCVCVGSYEGRIHDSKPNPYFPQFEIGKTKN